MTTLAPVKINYLKDNDVFLVLRDGTTSDTVNLSLGPYETVRINPYQPEAVGYFFTNASQVVPNAVKALNSKEQTTILEQHFEELLSKDTKWLKEAYRTFFEERAKEVQGKVRSCDLAVI